MSTTPKIAAANYEGIKVTSILKALTQKGITEHLLIDEKNYVDEVKNYYKHYGFIDRKQMNNIWSMFWKFVMNDWRHGDVPLPQYVRK